MRSLLLVLLLVAPLCWFNSVFSFQFHPYTTTQNAPDQELPSYSDDDDDGEDPRCPVKASTVVNELSNHQSIETLVKSLIVQVLSPDPSNVDETQHKIQKFASALIPDLIQVAEDLRPLTKKLRRARIELQASSSATAAAEATAPDDSDADPTAIIIEMQPLGSDMSSATPDLIAQKLQQSPSLRESRDPTTIDQSTPPTRPVFKLAPKASAAAVGGAMAAKAAPAFKLKTAQVVPMAQVYTPSGSKNPSGATTPSLRQMLARRPAAAAAAAVTATLPAHVEDSKEEDDLSPKSQAHVPLVGNPLYMPTRSTTAPRR